MFKGHPGRRPQTRKKHQRPITPQNQHEERFVPDQQKRCSSYPAGSRFCHRQKRETWHHPQEKRSKQEIATYEVCQQSQVRDCPAFTAPWINPENYGRWIFIRRLFY
jgi:hypothetical protein